MKSPTPIRAHALRPVIRGGRGFALVIALMLMTLLSVIAVGLLSLSSISLRTAGSNEARHIASANARVALALAIGQLQAELGDDRRVTADGAILGGSVRQPNLAGVWDSAATNHTVNPLERAPDYAAWKDGKFRGWLVSNRDPAVTSDRDFAKLPPASDAPLLFSQRADGYEIRAGSLPIESIGGYAGSMAWAVSQEATKAQMTVGSDRPRVDGNDQIQAPTRPTLALSGMAQQPAGNWDLRSVRVLSPRQAALDADYAMDPAAASTVRREHSIQSRGVLVDVVKGGLKTDLSLGFELSDSDFKAVRWGNVRNPFASGIAPGGEAPLYQPVNGGGTINLTMNYGSVSNYTHTFHTGSAPTFQSLRSHYLLYRHAYRSEGLPTAFFRPQSSPYWPDLPSPRGSETSVSPVLDRVLFFVSFYADAQGILNVVLTPVITLWNPYNVSVESEGFVVYPWMDMPIFLKWFINDVDKGTYALSQFLGEDKTSTYNGRQAEPYFLCNLTASGTNDLRKPVRLGPGEVRIFVPSSPGLQLFQRRAPLSSRTIQLRPVESIADLNLSGGLRIRMTDGMANTLPQVIQNNDKVHAKLTFTRDEHHYFVSMEDAGRIKGAKPRVISEIQVHNGKLATQSITTRPLSGRQLKVAPQAAALLETFHRTAGQSGQMADLVFTVNPRQRYVNAMLSASSGFAAGPHYEASIREVSDFISEAFQTTTDGRRSFYGYSNAPNSGRDALSFYEIPREPMLSLGAFQHADLSDTAFSPGSQFANAWASPFVGRNAVARLLRNSATPGGERFFPTGLGIYDHSYLLNAAIWDGYYFSSIAPETELAAATGNPGAYDGTRNRVIKGTADVIRNWVERPAAEPLRNPRHLLHAGNREPDEIIRLLKTPAGCRHAAAHLLVDGSFNVNSVNEAAWRAVLASLRGSDFRVESGTGSSHAYDAGTFTPVPRLRRPIGSPDDIWNGFRKLNDDEITTLASEIVKEVRVRGPFQSLGEFVNRRLTPSNDELGLKGALQAAIDRSGINKHATVTTFQKAGYPFPGNLPEPNTGTGTPGWLTQADLLNALAPVITVRSDTFTVRGYGEARDGNGKVLARAWCEAVVQRMPEWLDPEDDPIRHPTDLTPASARFGRRFETISFRELSREEFDA